MRGGGLGRLVLWQYRVINVDSFLCLYDPASSLYVQAASLLWPAADRRLLKPAYKRASADGVNRTRIRNQLAGRWGYMTFGQWACKYNLCIVLPSAAEHVSGNPLNLKSVMKSVQMNLGHPTVIEQNDYSTIKKKRLATVIFSHFLMIKARHWLHIEI